MIAVERSERIAVLYQRHAATVRRLVARRATVPVAVIEDACQTAWTRLCEHTEVGLDDERAVTGWLLVTAVREAWRYTTRRRETAAGAWLVDTEDAGELPEPVAGGLDPLEVALVHERLRAMSCLTDREKRFVGLQAAGLSYEEIAVRLEVSVRTTERQILRGRRTLREGRRR
jgi:RNA polymerase sigma factor (sigma-70 family)